MELRQQEALTSARNQAAVSAVWELISAMHYGLDVDAFSEASDRFAADMERVPRRSVSDEVTHEAVSTLVDSLGDPYSAYASPAHLRTQAL